jgi:hypothetical protein
LEYGFVAKRMARKSVQSVIEQNKCEAAGARWNTNTWWLKFASGTDANMAIATDGQM